MKISLIAFSPTGGTEKAARMLCDAIADEHENIDLVDHNFNGANPHCDLAVIAMPSYGGRVPGIAAERLKKISGSGIPCVLLCVYGNRAYEDTLIEMADIAESCGFITVAAVAAIARHSLAPQIAAGRPDAKDRAVLEKFAMAIKNKIASGNVDLPFPIPGNRPYKNFPGSAFSPEADDECVACGICALECPTSAIDADDAKITDTGKCIACMRCVVKCPVKARKVDEKILAKIAAMLQSVCPTPKDCELHL